MYGEADYNALAVVPNHRVKTAWATMYFLLYVAAVSRTPLKGAFQDCGPTPHGAATAMSPGLPPSFHACVCAAACCAAQVILLLMNVMTAMVSNDRQAQRHSCVLGSARGAAPRGAQDESDGRQRRAIAGLPCSLARGVLRILYTTESLPPSRAEPRAHRVCMRVCVCVCV
jgi:hypothetical protein